MVEIVRQRRVDLGERNMRVFASDLFRSSPVTFVIGDDVLDSHARAGDKGLCVTTASRPEFDVLG